MANIRGTTRAQTFFLRSCAKNPNGPLEKDWPIAAVLRRWLRRKAFVRALADIRKTHNFRADFHLSASSSQAALSLESLTANNALAKASDSTAIANCKSQIANAISVLRLSHLRQRFAAQNTIENQKSKIENPPQLTREQEVHYFQTAIRALTRGDPKMTLAEARQYWDSALESLLADYARDLKTLTPASQFARDLK